MSDPTTCAVCGVALFSPAACYGPVGGPTLCVLCWLETAELMNQIDTLDGDYHPWIFDEALRRLPERHGRRVVGPMLPLEG